MTKNTKMLIGGGILAIALYYLWSKSKSKKPTTTTTPTTSTTSTTTNASTKETIAKANVEKAFSQLETKKQLIIDALREQAIPALKLVVSFDMANSGYKTIGITNEKLDLDTQKKFDETFNLKLKEAMDKLNKDINAIPNEKLSEVLSGITIDELKRFVELSKMISTPQGQTPQIQKEIESYMKKLDKFSESLPKNN